MTVVMTAGISKKIASYTIPLAVYFVTVRELQGLQRFKSDSKVLFDTFSFKRNIPNVGLPLSTVIAMVIEVSERNKPARNADSSYIIPTLFLHRCSYILKRYSRIKT